MRISELHLSAYGPFTDRILDFSESNFHLIFGPNEAGKSTALRAIDALLFGISQRTTDNFLHQYGEMKVGATVLNDVGRELTFARRKKLKKSLVTLDEAEKVLPENVLDDFLKGMQRDRFNRLYCIDHDEFRSGGNLMRELKGLANESLVAASHGGGFSDVEAELRDRAQNLWAPKRPSTKIRKQIKAYETAKKEGNEHRAQVRDWKTLSDERDQLLSRKSAIADEQTKLETERSRLNRISEALPRIARWKNLNAQLDGEDVRILPDSYSVDRRRDCAAELASTNQRIKTLDEKLCNLESEITSALSLPEVLQNSERIDWLQQRIDSHRQSTERLQSSQQNRDDALKQIQHWLNELGSDIDPTEANTLRIQSEVRAAINELNPQAQSLRERPVAIAKEQADKSRELESIKKQLETLGETADGQRLSNAIRSAGRHLQVESELADAKDALQEQEEVVKRALARLPDWYGTLDELLNSKFPLRETVDKFNNEFMQLQGKIDLVGQQLETRNDELVEIRQEIVASQKASAVVTEEDLTHTRAERDRGWQLVKKTYIEEQKPPPAEIQTFAGANTLAHAYEKRVTEADNIADRLRREAKRVGELTKQMEREAGLAKSVAKLSTELDKHRQSRSDLEKRWNSQWTASGIRNPGTPSEMVAWLDRYSEITQASTAIDRERQRVTKLDQTHKRQTDELLSVVQQFDASFAHDSLTQVHTHGEQLHAQIQECETQREQLLKDQSRIEQESQELTPLAEQANEELQRWESQWAEAMQAIGCDENVTAAQALARVHCLRELATSFAEWERCGADITSAQQRIEEFEQEVQSLVNSVGQELTEHTAVEAATLLKEKLEKARSLKQAADERERRRQTLKEEIDGLKTESNDLNSTLAQFLSLAGVKSLDGIDKIEALSLVASQKSELDEELRQTSAGQDLDQFIAEAEMADGDELKAQISNLNTELSELKTKRDEIGKKIGEVETRMEEIDGNDAAARADQQAMNCLSQIYDDARQFLRLRIAETILRQQVERYRDENKDPLLAKASQYFSEMTDNEFLGLESDYDESGEPIIVGLRKNKEKVLTEAMSDGTLDPLFLSLRLAYLQEKLAQFEPMPLVVDDILIHLDDERALATLKVLVDFSKQTQVLFFTHHRRLQELTEEHLTNDVTVHELQRREVVAG